MIFGIGFGGGKIIFLKLKFWIIGIACFFTQEPARARKDFSRWLFYAILFAACWRDMFRTCDTQSYSVKVARICTMLTSLRATADKLPYASVKTKHLSFSYNPNCENVIFYKPFGLYFLFDPISLIF